MEKLKNININQYILVFAGLALGIYTLLNIDLILEIVGMIYVAKFAYNNLLFKQERDKFIENLIGKLDKNS